MLTGLLSREASPSSILAWEEVLTGGGGASDLWDGDMTASTVAAFPMVECSNSQLDSSAITQVSRSSTSIAMLILGFKGVLGGSSCWDKCVLCLVAKLCILVPLRGSTGILSLMCGCLVVVTLAPLCSGSGRVMVTGCSFLFKPTS